jgi:hypothetical protein
MQKEESVMKRLNVFSGAVIAALAFAGVRPAMAQNVYPYGPPSYGPYSQTQLSPYLNFLRGGLPAANYYVGTLPEFQRREQAKVFQGEITTAINYANNPVGGALLPDETGLLRPLPQAGHPTAFGYTGNYFGGGTLPGGGGMAGMGRPPVRTQPPQQSRQGPLGAMPPANPFSGQGFGR